MVRRVERVDVRGEIAVVTGGAQGIGAAVVARLTDAGARVAVLDVLPVTAPAVHGVTCDVADEDAVREALAEVEASLGPPRLAVLNAGVGGFAPLLTMTAAEWDRVMAVNLRGAFLCLREVALRMVEAGEGGSIVLTSSVSGTTAERGMAHYGASKAAVDHLVRTAARELGPAGIRVNGVAPGTTETPLFASTAGLPGFAERVRRRTPLGRIGSADEVAEVAVALLALGWVTGQVLAADGGLSLFSPIDPLEDRPGRG